MTEDREAAIPLDTAAFVTELRRLADALETGASFTIHVDGEDVTIPGSAAFFIVHEREDDDVELEFEIAWSLPDADSKGEEETIRPPTRVRRPRTRRASQAEAPSVLTGSNSEV